jgi:hypothetical protein
VARPNSTRCDRSPKRIAVLALQEVARADERIAADRPRRIGRARAARQLDAVAGLAHVGGVAS